MLWLRLPLALLAAHLVAQFGYALSRLLAARHRPAFLSPQNRRAGAGLTLEEKRETDAYSISHVVEDGIERVVYTPKNRSHETPILMTHGMWHGAWCWETWQALLAEWGWESVAYSLPGHAQSPAQRPLWLCSLDYYLAFLRDEASRLPRKPILMGHSMGGALVQWYLKFIDQTLPAAVLVAPWTSHSVLKDSLPLFWKIDPTGVLLTSAKWHAGPLVRNPQVAARALTTDGAILQPEALFARLNAESALVTLQHNPPFWTPPQHLQTPMLLLAGEQDAIVPFDGLKRSAAFYRADFLPVPEAGHNLMMEKSYQETARKVNDWLAARGL